jgi:hypothetical protein
MRENKSGWAKHRDPISKITNTKRVDRMAQVVKHPVSKLEALSSTPSTTKKKS